MNCANFLEYNPKIYIIFWNTIHKIHAFCDYVYQNQTELYKHAGSLVPCVMYPYWHNYKAECMAFIQARRAVGVHSESTVVEDWAGSGAEGDNYYTALIQGTNGQLFLKLGYDCNPTDAPMVAAPAGKRWQCAWANRDHAGVWYTVDDSTPTNVESAPNQQAQSTKRYYFWGARMYYNHIAIYSGR